MPARTTITTLLVCAGIALSPAHTNGQAISDGLKDLTIRAELGDPEAQFHLGSLYAKGDGVPKDGREAVRWFRKAAEQGYAKAQYNLGFMYDLGEDEPQNNVEAVIWYRKAAKQGLDRAQFRLGIMYENGEGVPKNLVKAYYWHSFAAAHGNKYAQRNKDVVAGMMSRAQIVEADILAAACLEKLYKECD